MTLSSHFTATSASVSPLKGVICPTPEAVEEPRRGGSLILYLLYLLNFLYLMEFSCLTN